MDDPQMAEDNSSWSCRIFSDAADPILVVALDGSVLEMNAAAERLYGYSRDELSGQPLRTLVAAEQREQLDGLMARCREGQSVRCVQSQHLNRDGQPITLLLSLSLLRDEQGQPSAVAVIEKEISARPESELERELAKQQRELFETHLYLRREVVDSMRLKEALEDERARLQSMLASLADAVVVSDLSGRVQYINPVAENLTGWPLDEARGQPLEKVFQVTEITPTGTAHPVERLLAQTLQTQEVRVFPEQGELLGRDGRTHAVSLTAGPLKDAQGGLVGAVTILRQAAQITPPRQRVGQRRTAESLMGLVDRYDFEQRLLMALSGCREGGERHALCYLELGRLQEVSDTSGAQAAEALIHRLTSVLLAGIRSRDTVSRLGRDRFGVLLEHCPPKKAVAIAEAMVERVREFRFLWEGRRFQVDASVGVVPLDGELDDAMELLTIAGEACAVAREEGGNRVYEYPAHPRMEHPRASLPAAEIGAALERSRFRLFCQPILPLREVGEPLRHYEILIRLLDSQERIILPEDFLPAADRLGMMPEIDRWVIRSAVHLLAEGGRAFDDVEFNINLSEASLLIDSTPAYIQQQLSEFKIAPERVCFEIPESALLCHPERVIRLVKALKGAGCHIALDNFGTHMAGFGRLKELPLDYLKIDGRIVEDIDREPLDQAVVSAINQIGHIMPVKTIASFACNDEVVARLRSLDVDYAQGNRLGEPKPLEEGVVSYG